MSHLSLALRLVCGCSLSLTALVASGCGGGDGGAPGTGTTLTLPVLFDRTGSMLSNGSFTGMLASNSVVVGDSFPGGVPPELESRGFVGINLATVPAGATIVSAKLVLVGRESFGNPNTDFGPMRADHVDVGAGLDPGDFNSLPARSLGVPPVNATDTTVELDVTEALRADLALGKTSLVLRLVFPFSPKVDNQTDVVIFFAIAAGAPNQQPFVTVTLP